MARRSLLITASMLLAAATGCQTQSPATQPSAHHLAASSQPANAEREYRAVPASALVFDPPVIQDEPRLELSRAEREPRVTLGYEDQVAEYYYIRFDDRQIGNGILGNSSHGGRFGVSGNYDQYERQAVTVRTGVRYR